MVSKFVLLAAVCICLSWQQPGCLSDESPNTSDNDSSPSIQQQGDQSPTQNQVDKLPSPGSESSKSTIEIPPIDKAIGGIVAAGARSLEPWLKTFGDISKGVQDVTKGGGDNPIASLMNIIKPTTTEAPATKQYPFAQNLDASSIIQGPSKVVNALASTFNVSKVAEVPAMKELAKVGQQTEKVFTKISGIHLSAPPESENVYYEYSPSDEWDGHRKPRYYSKECNFRLACEVGQMMKPMLGPVAHQFRTNKIVQDLQSRYSRAMAYGTLHDNCEKYYCVFLQLFGGPQKFVAASAEIVSRIAQPEPVPEER